MITDTRLISFSVEALAEAVRLFGQARREASFVEVRDVYVRPGTPPVMVAEVAGSEPHQATLLEFSAAETAAALILLCRREHIPLPHHADKSLRLIGDELCLVIYTRMVPRVAPGANRAEENDEGTGDDAESQDGC